MSIQTFVKPFRFSRQRKAILQLAITGVIAAGTFVVTSTAFAGDGCGCEAAVCDCGCETADPSCGLELGPGCGMEPMGIGCGLEPMGIACGMEPMAKQSCPRKPGPIYRGLDALAGGIEKLFRLDKCNAGCGCDSASCDGGCGFEMGGGGMIPVQSSPIYSESYPTNSGKQYVESAPRMAAPHDSAPRMSAPRMASPHIPMQMSEPRIRSTPAPREPMDNPAGSFSAPRSTVPRSTVPRSTRAVPVPRAEPPTQRTVPTPSNDPSSKGESLFDTLSDPFTEDDARIERNATVRPTIYSTPASPRTVRRTYTR